jgi:hypothetical protein
MTSPDDPPGNSPMHVFRRHDIARLRLTLRKGQAPVELDIRPSRSLFFHDLDLVQLNLEVRAENLPLDTVRDILFRFGRAYPSGWEEGGEGLHNVYLAEWLGADGQVVARSDAETAGKIPELCLPSIAAPAFPSTGPACCGRWCWPIPTSRATCATG